MEPLLVESAVCAVCDLRAQLRGESDRAHRELAAAERFLSADAAPGATTPARDIELVKTVSASRRQIAALELVLLDLDCDHGDTNAVRTEVARLEGPWSLRARRSSA